MIYLDYNATTPVRAEAMQAMSQALALVGNPSSVHGAGREVRQYVEDARRAVASALSTTPNRVIFTSGGTEANALALAGAKHILYSAIEHDCIRESARHFDPQAHIIPVTPAGEVDIDQFSALLKATPQTHETIVSVMLSNNETGVIQPIQKIADITHAHGGWLHCDAVQAIGKIPVHMDDLGADSLSVSAHKFGGPKGVGALVHREPASLTATTWGGGQEKRKRSGTENVPGIAGLGAAITAAIASMPQDMARVLDLRNHMEDGLISAVPSAVIYGRQAKRVANTTCIQLPGVRNEMQLMHLDLAGIAVSSGSACSSGKVTPSHVLEAMGLGPQAATEAIRISLGWETSPQDIDTMVQAWAQMARSLCQKTS